MIDTGVPLGVRIYDIKDGVDRHVTKWVDDFSFRHTAPGGCASCTIRFRVPPDSNVDPLLFGNLYYKVQIFDGRSAEVVWEGRVEDPATQTEEDAWELGVLGGQKATTDVAIPSLYVDNTISNWIFWEDIGNYESTREEVHNVIIGKMKPNYEWHTTVFNEYLTYDGWANAGGIARVSSTVKANAFTSQGANFEMIMYLNDDDTPVDVTAMNVSDTYKTNVIGTDFSHIGRALGFKVRRKAGTGNYTITANDDTEFRFKWPKVVGLRLDELGNTLTSPADYPGDYVLVHQVVRDVVGKYLGGSWWTGIRNFWDTTSATARARYNSPAPGSIRGTDAFIDTSDTQKITNLWWNEKVDAKTILDTLMQVQRNAYWAVWPSDHRFVQGSANTDLPEYQFRFAWATWPRSWNYAASSQDGMSQQITGDNLYNAAAMHYKEGRSDFIDVTTNLEHSETGFVVGPGSGNIDWEVEELDSRFTRMTYFEYPHSPATENISGVIGEDYIRQEMAAQQDPVNVGRMVIRRPIYMIDDGSGSGDGFAGMVHPWQIKPGRLIMVKDIHPFMNASQMQWDSGFPRTLNPNTGFESGTTGWFSAGGTFIQASDQKYSGSFAGKITPTGAAADTYIATNVWPLVTPGEYYRVSAWVRCAVARSITLRFDYNTSTPVFISSASDIKTVAANLWTYFEIVTKAPATAWQAPALVLMSGTPPASNVMWVDEFKVEHLAGFPKGHENSIFRVAATEYSTSDNACTLELDELPRWDLSTQVAAPNTSGNLRAR